MDKHTLAEINDMIDILENTAEGLDEESDQFQRVQDMLEEWQAEKDAKIIAVAKWRKRLNQQEEGIWKAEADHVRRKRSALKNKMESLTGWLMHALGGINKIKTDLGTVYIVEHSSVIINDLSRLPLEYCDLIGEIKDGHEIVGADGCKLRLGIAEIELWRPNKNNIKLAIMDGKEVPGASLVKTTSVQYR